MRKIELEELKQIQLQILDEVVDFCTKHQIKYFLMAGTLLGAVRHQGYIPWDDDIDIGMLREDYERFLELYSKEQGNYYLYNMNTSKSCSLFFTKLCLKNTLEVDKNLVHQEKNGLGIDIFPIDDVKSKNYITFANKLKTIIRMRNAKAIKLKEFFKKSWINGMVVFFVKCILFFVSYDRLYFFAMKEIYKEKKNTNNIFVRGNVIWGYGAKELVNYSIFDEEIEILFEGKMYTCPKRYDEWLRSIYGNYMELPPIEKRIAHNREVYFL